jgi:hypothetical protein
MDTDIRIPVTAELKQLIAEAVADEPGGLAAWARQVLSRAARERIAEREGHRSGGREESHPEGQVVWTHGAGATELLRWEGEVAAIREFLDQVYRLSGADKVHAAGDLIFDFVQPLLKGGDFAACDRLLLMVDVSKLKPALRITFLFTTLTARRELRTREDYYSRVLKSLVDERGTERATKLLGKYR